MMDEDLNNWIDRRGKTPLNACSLEVLQKGHGSTRNFCPMVIGCYELCEGGNTTDYNNRPGNEVANKERDEKDRGGVIEETDEEQVESSKSNSRNGALLLHMIPSSPSMNNDTSSAHKEHGIRFGNCNQELHTDSGVLDGKWYQRSSIQLNNSEQDTHLYATACASGAIELYHLQSPDHMHNGENLTSDPDHSNGNEWKLKLITSSLDFCEDGDDHGLALALAWDESIDLNSTSSRIISSYSKGSLAVHNVNVSSVSFNCNETNNDSPIIMDRTHRWVAHTLFGCVAEVWTTCFASNEYYSTHSDIVISGGDDCKMKLWDLRSCFGSKNKPIHSIGEEEFGAGVTAVTYHPYLEHVFCAGSYDESIRLWDMRKMDSTEPLCSLNVGGGVWRVKWHPTDYHKILVGAMHGGCRVVEVPILSNLAQQALTDDDANLKEWTLRIQKEFVEHKSMAYGADWIHSEGSHEAAASCSFYDRQAFIWETQ